MIDIKGLSYSIQGRSLLKDITILIDDGEILGIIGRSGSGKSVLLRILAGLLNGYNGTITIDTIPFPQYLKENKQTGFSFCHGHIPANKDDTLKNFLFLSRIPYKKMFRDFSDYDTQVVEEYINQMNLQDFINSPLGSLSDSILKKSMLAHAFIREAKIIALDDPTTHLDINSIMLLNKVVSKYVIHGDKTALIGANDLNFILQTADRIIVLDEGKIAAVEIPENITKGIIQRYFKTEILLTRNIYNGKPEIHLYPGN